MTPETSKRFLKEVTSWLNANPRISTHRKGVEVTDVKSYSSDWEGDSESGFFSVFNITIFYKDLTGRESSILLEGDEMGSLWNYVISGYPDDVAKEA